MARRFMTNLLLLVAFALSLMASSHPQSLRGTHSAGHGVLEFRAVGQMTVADLEVIFAANFKDVHSERTARLEDGLRTLFTALPKTEQGRLGHDAVRYALHRFFLNQHGWFIRGLEPGNRTWSPEKNKDRFFKEWVPSKLQELLEHRVGKGGADLHEVAVMAASLEDIIDKEAAARLSMVYKAHDLEVKQALGRDEAADLLMSYFYSFSIAHNISVATRRQLKLRRDRFLANFPDDKVWFQGVIDRHFGAEHVLGGGELHDFNDTLGVVSELGQSFHVLNELECKSLKATLSGLEGRRPGRVRLSTFYNASRYGHWNFEESIEFMRSLGVVDETDPKNPSVIIANYATSRGNCLDASHLFTVCCHNPCESMMGHLEAELATDRTEPDNIASLISQLSSESVKAPRTLPTKLLSRLDEIAQHHGGQVPIHGRLFAQWMHHAYPMECPYPHVQGLNPQTAAEWMSDTQAVAKATAEDMEKTVAADKCAIDWLANPDCAEEDTELPWVMEEDLIMSRSEDSRSMQPEGQGAGENSINGVWRLVLVLLSLAVLVGAGLLDRSSSSSITISSSAEHPGQPSESLPRKKQFGRVASLVALAVLGHCLELLNGWVVFGVAFVAVGCWGTLRRSLQSGLKSV